MQDFMGAYVSKVDKFGHQEDVDEVVATASVRGSFRVKYYANVYKVCVDVRGQLGSGDIGMQLTLDQAILLRELLAAGIADMQAAKTAQVLELPAGGDAA
ncbi:hypothetical protein C8258_25795 [Nocardia sp. MDA0666]|uniref:hypothetical protein n=1 Tax=Nocardia sp. MDA0666 TaxID=2135448 RepID=UPI000D12F901|nr:hypothetical protein [Nocardia sp. MDA0666]PSR62126.1 hypothetical protein C8258_25795 [Nocardia sp. MDA0666]